MNCTNCKKEFKKDDVNLKLENNLLYRVAYCFDCNIYFKQSVHTKNLPLNEL